MYTTLRIELPAAGPKGAILVITRMQILLLLTCDARPPCLAGGYKVRVTSRTTRIHQTRESEPLCTRQHFNGDKDNFLSSVAAGSLLAFSARLGRLLFWIFQIVTPRTDLFVRCEGCWLLALGRLRDLLHYVFVLAQLHYFQEIGCTQQARLVLQALPAALRVPQLILQILFVQFQLLLSFQ